MRITPYQQNMIDFQKEYQENVTFIAPFKRYLQAKEPKYGKGNYPGDYTFRMFELNPLTVARLTYDYYCFAALLEKYTNLSEEEKSTEKEVFWLKYQLSWLKLKYDPKCWIDYPEYERCQHGLADCIKRFNGKLMSKEQQRDFRDYFIGYTRTSHPPLISKQNKASLSTINKFFQKWELSFRIDPIVHYRKTYWKITKISDKNQKN